MPYFVDNTTIHSGVQAKNLSVILDYFSHNPHPNFFYWLYYQTSFWIWRFITIFIIILLVHCPYYCNSILTSFCFYSFATIPILHMSVIVNFLKLKLEYSHFSILRIKSQFQTLFLDLRYFPTHCILHLLSALPQGFCPCYSFCWG